ncbi:MAG TPA: hypothetical protein VFV13_03750 [Acidimicrobiia bacterium]|nr:hypothetical protein [Acidimicrobiia bacterium]
MTTLLERDTAEITRVPERSGVTEWVLGILGVVAAGVGLWMYYVPTTWFLGGLAEGWYLGAFVGAGLLLAAAFGLFARRILHEDGVWTTQSVMATGLSVLALAGAIVFGLVWIL